MTTYIIQSDGDPFEKRYWNDFISNEWPEYELFWQKHVTPLTNRPSNLHFKDDATLISEGHSVEDICIAQLHYSILRHLGHIYGLLQNPHPYIDQLTEVFVRIVGAQDIAFELLERYTNPGGYDPWLPKKRAGILGSREAKSKWQQNHSCPLQDIRNYRNHLVHGRMIPGVIADTYYFPGIGREEDYFDWRVITSSNTWQAEIGHSLFPSISIGKEAWEKTLSYLRSMWTSKLLT